MLNFPTYTLLLISTLIAQCVNLLSLPIITRLYSPLEYSHFAIFLSLSSLFLPFITLRLDLGIASSININFKKGMLIYLSRYSILASFFIAVCYSVYEYIFIGHYIKESIFSSITLFFLLLGQSLIVFLISLSLKNGNVINIALSSISQNTFTAIFQLIFGVISPSWWSLNAGYLLGRFSSIASFKKIISDELKSRDLYSLPDLLDLIRPRKGLILAGFFDALTFACPIFLLNIFFTKHEVGLASMAFTLAQVPVTLFSGNYISTVLARSNLSKKFIPKETIKLPVILFFTVFLSEIFFVKSGLFSIILGSRWNEIPYYFLAISLPISLQIIFTPFLSRLFVQENWIRYLRISYSTFFLSALFSIVAFFYRVEIIYILLIWTWSKTIVLSVYTFLHKVLPME